MLDKSEKNLEQTWLEKKTLMMKDKLALMEISGMRPAISHMYCCSVAAAAGGIAVYVLVAYTIAFAFELVWLVEANKERFPPASAILIVCFIFVLMATLILIHGLFTDDSRCLLIWLITVILTLVPECSVVFYTSISYWGLNNVYGASQMICYISRLPAIVGGIVIVQSCYAIKKINANIASNNVRKISNNLGHLTESEFNASMYTPSENNGNKTADGVYTNSGFMEDEAKISRSMPDLRKKMDSIRLKMSNQKMPTCMVPVTPPPYWLIPDVNEENLANMHYQQMYRKMPHFHPGHYGTMPRRYWFENQMRPSMYYYGYQPNIAEDKYIQYLNPERRISTIHDSFSNSRELPMDSTDGMSRKDNFDNEMKYRDYEYSSHLEGRSAGMRSGSAGDLRQTIANPQLYSPYGLNLYPQNNIDLYKTDPLEYQGKEYFMDQCRFCPQAIIRSVTNQMI